MHSGDLIILYTMSRCIPPYGAHCPSRNTPQRDLRKPGDWIWGDLVAHSTGEKRRIQENPGKSRKIQENSGKSRRTKKKPGENRRTLKTPDNFGESLAYSNKVAQNEFMDKIIASLTKVNNE